VLDQDGHELNVLEHRASDEPAQVLFVRTRPNTRTFQVALAIQQGRFVEFLARPTFPATPAGAAFSLDAPPGVR
jgi:hypothetical protein